MLFVVAVGVTGARIVYKYQAPGKFVVENQGYCDFHNGVYYPAVGFVQGNSPYAPGFEELYPVHRPLPFLSPVILILHSPLAILDLRTAEVVYFFLSVSLVLLFSGFIAYQILVANSDATGYRFGAPGAFLTLTLILATFITISRGGQQTLFTGYFTFEILLATLVAVHFGNSRWALTAIALLVVSSKPNYVLPLGMLMLAQANWKSVIMGGLLSVVGAVSAVYWLEPVKGLQGFWNDVQLSQQIHLAEVWEMPVNNWVRVDATALVAKWANWNPGEETQLLIMFAFVLPVSILIGCRNSRYDTSSGVMSVNGALLLLVPIVAVYHQAYDAILALPVAVSAWFSRDPEWAAISSVKRSLIGACCLVPAVNYLSSQMLISRLGLEGLVFQIVTSINAVALLLAVSLLIMHIARMLVQLPANTPAPR